MSLGYLLQPYPASQHPAPRASSYSRLRVMPLLRQEPSDDDQLRAFRACPPLDAAAAPRLCPEIMTVVMQITSTLGVCWQWTLAALLSMVSGLVPQARYELAPSIEVPSSLWVVLLHPGGTNSSGVVRLVIQTLQKLFTWRADVEAAAAEAATEEGKDVEYPPRRQLLAGGGSLAATGLQMSLSQNRSAALVAEPEIGSLLQWFSGTDSGIDSSAVAKIWDGVTWDRPVMDKHRAFSVRDPWLGFITGAHIGDTFKATVRDVFGFRQRVTALYGEPLWSRLEDINAACRQLPLRDSHKPEDCLATLLVPLLRWSLRHKRLSFAASDQDGAQERTAQNFNAHVDMQKDAYLKPGRHEEARFHGKLRTKFDRLVLAVHILNSICVAWAGYLQQEPRGPAAGADWSPDFVLPESIGLPVVEFAYLFADHAEAVWKVLDFARCGHCLPEDTDPADPTQPVPPLADARPDFANLLRSAKTSHWDTISKDNLSDFLRSQPQDVVAFWQQLPLPSLPQLTVQVLRSIMSIILSAEGRWFYYNRSTESRKAVRRALPADIASISVFVAFVASFILQSLGSWCRRADRCILRRWPPKLVAALGVRAGGAPSLQAYSDAVQSCTHAPARAPTWHTVSFPRHLDVAQRDALLAGLRDWEHVAAAPAALRPPEALPIVQPPAAPLPEEELAGPGFDNPFGE